MYYLYVVSRLPGGRRRGLSWLRPGCSGSKLSPRGRIALAASRGKNPPALAFPAAATATPLPEPCATLLLLLLGGEESGWGGDTMFAVRPALLRACVRSFLRVVLMCLCLCLCCLHWH